MGLCIGSGAGSPARDRILSTQRVSPGRDPDFIYTKSFARPRSWFYLHKEYRAAGIRIFSTQRSSTNFHKKNHEKLMIYLKNFPRCARTKLWLIYFWWGRPDEKSRFPWRKNGRAWVFFKQIQIIEFNSFWKSKSVCIIYFFEMYLWYARFYLHEMFSYVKKS